MQTSIEPMTVLVGSKDWQSPQQRCEEMCEAAGGDLIVAEGKGHDLGRETVVQVLDHWL